MTSGDSNGDALPTPPRVQHDAMARPLPKRFYRLAGVGPEMGGRFQILLDGRGAKTPKKLPLAVPHARLAAAVADEWNAQGAQIDPTGMPLTRLVTTVIDAVTGQEAVVAADIVAFAGSDLLCYRAQGPVALTAQQAAVWDPILDWANSALDARFKVTSGLMPVAQPPEATAAIDRALEGLDAFQIAAMHALTTISGSAILALAHARGHLTIDAMWSAAHIDEDWQITQWGADEEAQSRRAGRQRDAEAAAFVLAAFD